LSLVPFYDYRLFLFVFFALTRCPVIVECSPA
jgi:hypothetical protein